MWNRPQLMIAVSDLLTVAAAAALLVAAVLWSAHQPWWPVHEVLVISELHEVRRSELQRSLAGRMQGNFFSTNLEMMRQSLEQLPWVRRAEVRRQWPARIEVGIEEHRPVAFWGQATGQLVNSYGEIFAAAMHAPATQNMPLLIGPTGIAPEVLSNYQQAEELLRPLGRVPRALTVSPRLAVQLRLDDGMIVELGRQQAKSAVRQRLERFVEYYPSVLAASRQHGAKVSVAGTPAAPVGSALPAVVVDMRYPNGFALRVAANANSTAAATERKP